MNEKKIKILLIEDNPGDARLIQEMLKEFGESKFALECAGRLSAGLERLAKGGLDVILLDLGLPESYGLPTLEKILSQSIKALPIVVLTGSIADEMVGIKAVQKGAQDYLTKGLLDGKLLVRSIRYAIERKRMEALMKRSEERFRTIIQTAPSIIICLSPEGRILEFNPEAERIYGCKREEVLGKDYFELFIPEEVREAIIEDMKKVLAGKPTRGFENPVKGANGSKRFFMWNVDRLNDDQGYPVGVVAIGQDITERKRNEEELRKQRDHLEYLTKQLTAVNKELEAFSFTVSHDLRGPLNRIVGFCEILLKDYNNLLDENGKNYLQRVIVGGMQMGGLINDLLNFARVTRSQMHRKKVNLSDLVKMIAEELRETQPERHVKFVIAKGLVTHGDPQLLRIALVNLLGNAWKFTRNRPDARIEFGVTQHNDRSAYFVRDNGVGFDMASYDKLFDAFQRLHADEFEGTGIGLATVQRIIHRHDGHIWAEGAMGQGATFYFTIPLRGEKNYE